MLWQQQPWLFTSLLWQHNERNGISNYQRLHCLPNCLFRCRSKKNIKAPHHWSLWGESTSDRWIPQRDSNAENASIPWHHVICSGIWYAITCMKTASSPMNIVESHYFMVNTLRPGPNGRHFADNIFKSIFLNENIWISLKIALKLVPEVRINNIPALFQIMAWRRSGDKPLSGTMMVSLLTHICITRPQWVMQQLLTNV